MENTIFKVIKNISFLLTYQIYLCPNQLQNNYLCDKCLDFDIDTDLGGKWYLYGRSTGSSPEDGSRQNRFPNFCC